MPMQSFKKFAHTSPGRTILISFILTIIIGSLLLALPIAHKKPLRYIDLLFTATSATCVTGLLTIPLDHFTPIGHAIILMLIQIGGLGLATLTLFLISLFTNLGLATQLMAGQLLEIETLNDVKRTLIFITSATLTIELIGTGIIFFTIKSMYPGLHGLFYALFHAVASFCNGGLTLLGNNTLHAFSSNTPLLAISTILIIAGSIGFGTWNELLTRYVNKQKIKLSLQSKLTLYTLCALAGMAFIVFWFLESHTVFASMPLGTKIINCLFHTFNSKSCGFNMLSLMAIHRATLLMIMVLAFIGSAPGSTGSGIKTTTFAIFTATIRAVLTGRQSVEILGRRIGHDQIFKAMAVIALSIGWIVIATFILLILEPHYSFIEVLFEVVSAFATLGLSLGITASLGLMSKCLIMATMLIGRIGSLTLLLAIRARKRNREFSYPEERVMIS